MRLNGGTLLGEGCKRLSNQGTGASSVWSASAFIGNALVRSNKTKPGLTKILPGMSTLGLSPTYAKAVGKRGTKEFHLPSSHIPLSVHMDWNSIFHRVP